MPSPHPSRLAKTFSDLLRKQLNVKCQSSNAKSMSKKSNNSKPGQPFLLSLGFYLAFEIDIGHLKLKPAIPELI